MKSYGMDPRDNNEVVLPLAHKPTRDLSNKDFNNNDTRGPRSVSAFIIRLSELAPRLVIKQMTLLIKQLDSEVSWFLFKYSPLG